MSHKYYNKIIEWGFLAFLFLYPISINPFFRPTFSLFKLTILRLFTLTFLILWLGKAIVQKKLKITSSPLLPPLFTLLTLTALSTIFSINLPTALLGEYTRFEGFLTQVNYFLIAFLFLNYQLNEKKRITRITFYFLAGATLVSLIAIFEHFFFNPVFFSQIEHLGKEGYLQKISARSIATFGNTVFLGWYLSMAFPFSLATFWNQIILKKHRLIHFFFLFAILTAMIFTYSRGAWVSAFLSTIFLLTILRKEFNKKLFISLIALILLVLLINSLPTHSGYQVTMRLKGLIETERGTSGGNRLIMWKYTLPIIFKYPLLGAGLDTYKLTFPRFKGSPWATSYRSALVDKAHNELLQIGATIGLFGVITFLWVIVLTFIKGLSFLQREKEKSYRFLTAGLLGAVLAYSIDMQFLFSQFAVTPFLWFFIGVVFSIISTKAREKDDIEIDLSKGKVKALYPIIALFLLSMLISLSLWLADVYYQKAQTINFGKQSSKEAIKLMEKATTLNPFESFYWSYLARNYLAIGKSSNNPQLYLYWLQKAEQCYLKSISLNPYKEITYYSASQDFVSAGQQLFRKDLIEKGISYAAKTLEINPYSSDHNAQMGNAYGSLGVLNSQKEMFKKALFYFKKSVQLDPQNADYYNLGWAYEKLGKIKEAIWAYKKAVELRKDKDAQKALKRLMTQIND